MIKVLIFDWGNVLASYDMEEVARRMSARLRVSTKGFREAELKNRLRHDLGEISTAEFVADMNEELKRDLSVEEYCALAGEFGMGRLNEELLAYVKLLKRRYKIFLLSNNSRPAKDAIERSGLAGIFDRMLFSFEAKAKKPERRFFEMLLQGTPYAFPDCLLIDDREDICRAAEGYGMQAVVFRDNAQLREVLSDRGIEPDNNV